MSLTACGPERTEIALKEVNNDDERENQAEEVVANTDIASYITGDYFDIEGYLVANGFTVEFTPAEMPHSNTILMAYCGNGFIYQIFSGIGMDDAPMPSNQYVIMSKSDETYLFNTPSSLDYLLNTQYEGFYMFSDQLAGLEYLVNNKNNCTAGSCPLAGSGIKHTLSTNASPVEHED